MDGPITVEEHVNKFMLSLKLGVLQHGDQVCKLFPFTIKGKATTRYFTLVNHSITSREIFEKQFIKKFGEDKTKASLIVEISNIRMNYGESTKYFNQIFISILNRIPIASRPRDDVLLRYVPMLFLQMLHVLLLEYKKKQQP